MSQRRYYRACGALAIVGALLLFMGTWLHPSQTDPNDSAAAFAEYAATSRAAWDVTLTAAIPALWLLTLTVGVGVPK